RTARDYHYVQLVGVHFLAQCTIAAVIFGLRELFPHSIAGIGRVVPVGEKQRLVEPCSHDIPRLWPHTGGAHIHSQHSFSRIALSQSALTEAAPSRAVGYWLL